jgi:hypothetical protein
MDHFDASAINRDGPHRAWQNQELALMAEERAIQQRAAKYRTDGTCLICLKEL